VMGKPTVVKQLPRKETSGMLARYVSGEKAGHVGQQPVASAATTGAAVVGNGDVAPESGSTV
jgi:hypothetical protein